MYKIVMDILYWLTYLCTFISDYFFNVEVKPKIYGVATLQKRHNLLILVKIVQKKVSINKYGKKIIVIFSIVC